MQDGEQETHWPGKETLETRVTKKKSKFGKLNTSIFEVYTEKKTK